MILKLYLCKTTVPLGKYEHNPKVVVTILIANADNATMHWTASESLGFRSNTTGQYYNTKAVFPVGLLWDLTFSNGNEVPVRLNNTVLLVLFLCWIKISTFLVSVILLNLVFWGPVSSSPQFGKQQRNKEDNKRVKWCRPSFDPLVVNVNPSQPKIRQIVAEAIVMWIIKWIT